MTTAIHPNLDPELTDAAPAMQALLGPSEPLTVEGIVAFRAELAVRFADLAPAPETNPNVVAEDRLIPGLEGDPEIRVRVHRPANQTTTLPCFYHIHGGGMIFGTIDGEDPQMALWVEKVDCVVVSVDYRLAPETPHPGLVHDCYGGLQWIASQADELNIDVSRIAVGARAREGASPPARSCSPAIGAAQPWPSSTSFTPCSTIATSHPRVGSSPMAGRAGRAS